MTSSTLTSLKRLLQTTACATLLCTAALPANAQNSETQQLLNRLDRLQREMTTLQSHVYKGTAPPPAAAAPAETAPAGDADPRIAARNSVRITQLENEIRNLTGRIEEVDHLLRQIQTRLDSLVADVDRRLTVLEGGRPSALSQTGLPAPSVQLPIAQPPPGAAPVLTPPPAVTVGRPPGVLGTIPREEAVMAPRGPDSVQPAPPQVQAAAPAVLPKGTDQEQYDYALSLMLQKQDFATAEVALRKFVETHPKSSLAGNAYYWLGETFYVRKNYQDAAFTFAEGFQKHPKGSKAADSLLKLGMSLAQLDQKKEACTAYSRLLSNFPKSSARLQARVQREQQRSGCE